MLEIVDIESWRQAVVQALAELATNVARFLPKLLGMLLLLAVGWIVSKLVQAAVRRVLHRAGVDRLAASTSFGEALRRAGIKAAPSRLFGALAFWTLFLTFLLSGVEALGLSAVTETIDRLIGFLPNVFAAGLIVLLGLLLGRFVRHVVSSGAAAANLVAAPRIGSAAAGLVVLFVLVLALEQLGVETVLLVTVLTVLVAAVSLTIGVSIALGARPVVTHILAGHFLRQNFPRGTTVEVRGHQGTVERVGAVDTVLRGADRSWSIPNGTLIEEVVQR